MGIEIERIEIWDQYEVKLLGPSTGNPFTQVQLTATFSMQHKTVSVTGFYDGEGVYRIRFMPQTTGIYHFTTESNCQQLAGITGSFECIAANEHNQGPVQVSDRYHFSYATGKRYIPVGTTSYGWAHQQEALATETLQTLAGSPFNKIRMCILPHYSPYSERHMVHYPFVGNAADGWNELEYNPLYFQMLEKRIMQLQQLGIEADLILFHPYNRQWGFDKLSPEADDAYIKYVMSRFASFRNVWWSIANEYDFMEHKTEADWLRIGELVAENNVYDQLLSIHNGFVLYEHWQPWITHVCMQDGLAVTHPGRAVVLRNVYKKPIIYDEVCYEGNLRFRWGGLLAEQLVSRYWRGITEGTYVGHGEVLRASNQGVDEVWTGIGGQLRGSSAERIQFYRDIMEAGPAEGMEPLDEWFQVGVAGKEGVYYLFYWETPPKTWQFTIPGKDMLLQEGSKFQVDIINTWNMTIERIPEIFETVRQDDYSYGDIYNRQIVLPAKRYLALRITACAER
ncbi:DUF5060 domain-containing protein [Paenibacillus yanchengensis]|uniref:DUF5060 domain-containing protein n=1 Tax=Paenibacillus yanchengensis TaxID=2035833 RepID=A0ABW4YQ70_9BACL